MYILALRVYMDMYNDLVILGEWLALSITVGKAIDLICEWRRKKERLPDVDLAIPLAKCVYVYRSSWGFLQ